MEDVGYDGQNVRSPVHNVMNCFFCMKQKPNCRGYRLRLKEDADPVLKKYEHTQFALCDECWDRSQKDTDYIPKSIVQFALAEKLLEDKGCGDYYSRKKPSKKRKK